jgi:hypothetical protein
MIGVSKFCNEKYELYEDNGKYFLRLEFDSEDDAAFYHIVIDKISFTPKLIGVYDGCGNEWREGMFLKLFFQSGFEILPNDNGEMFSMVETKKKVHKMTLEQIEEKLGYKVEIVG